MANSRLMALNGGRLGSALRPVSEVLRTYREPVVPRLRIASIAQSKCGRADEVVE